MIIMRSLSLAVCLVLADHCLVWSPRPARWLVRSEPALRQTLPARDLQRLTFLESGKLTLHEFVNRIISCLPPAVCVYDSDDKTYVIMYSESDTVGTNYNVITRKYVCMFTEAFSEFEMFF